MNRNLTQLKCIFIVILAILVFQMTAFGLTNDSEVEFYIAPNGNDNWTGKLSEPNSDKSDGPLATLNASRIKVREHISEGLSAPVTVWIRGGEYELDSTIIFGPEDSGTKEFPVHYRAWPNETPVFTGGKKLDNWKKSTVNPTGVSKAAKGNLWYCEIPEHLKGVWQITTLYDGKKLLSRSRSEKFKASDKQVLDPCNAQPKDVRGVDWDAEPLVFSREFRYSEDDLKAWETPSDIEIFLSPKHGWLINMLPLERIDTKSKTAYFAVDPTYGIRPGNEYVAENAIEYLDEPGEWIFNSKEGRVYIWPENSLEEADIRAPFLQEFIRVEGIEDSIAVRHLHFEGLTFRHGLRDTWRPGDKGLQHDWEMYDKGNAIIRFRHAEDCLVTGCTFEASSGTGVRFDLYGQRNKVADCVFAHLGGTGILLSGYGPGLKDENKFNTVTNNYIHHVGTIYKHSPGIFIAQSGHNLISHNTIHDLAYNGMVISGCRPHEMVLAKPLKNRREWVSSIRVEEIGPYIEHITPEMLDNWLEFDVSKIEPLLHARENRIEYNELYRVMLELHDGNGIYFSAMGKNNRAVRNYFHDIYNARGYIRLDDVSGYTIITHNVGVRGSMMIQIKGPGEIRNNFAIDTELFIARRWCPTEIDNFILYNTPQGEGHFNQYKRFPEVKMIYEFFDRVSNSLIYVEDPPEEIKLGQDVIVPDKRGSANVGMLFADPLFDEEAMKQQIFRFKPGSPAPALGIEPIDLSSAGSTLAKTRVYEVWDDQPAPNRGKDYSRIQARGYPADPDWEAHSYPIGNGYMGANIFGRTDMERIQVTEKTLTNGAPYGSGGMTNFAEIFLEFDHYSVNNYKRSLNLNEGICYVNYEHDGIKYSREYFANYPNNVIAIKLSASENAKISCTVSAVVPYLRSKNAFNHSAAISLLARYADTRAQENSITFAGAVPSFSLNYEGQIKIINEGGRLIPNNENGSNEIRIIDANSVLILIATGTNYKLSDEIFLTDSTQLKLNPDVFPHKEVTKTIENASDLGYEKLKESHLTDYQNLFSRVKLQLSPAVPQIPTKTLVENYNEDPSEVYLEELMFHFGRYLLIASSREGTLPCGLQGVWSQYHVTPWSGGYWHNINVQMNYWGAFNANLAETFVAYEEYFNAYLPKAYENGREYVKNWHPDVLSNKDKGNGWCIGTGANAYHIGVPGGHSGPGTGGFTTKLFRDRFEFTQDTAFLRETAYPALLGMSKFLSKTLVPSKDGTLLADRSASPEQRHNGVHYMTQGTTFDQGFVWETYNDLLESAKILEINDPFLETVRNQIIKLDPILIGSSGQIKEYREEMKYGEIGDPRHRHISHLCPIYPGTLINSNHNEWVKAASKTLDFRGNNTTGWAMAHRMNVRARTKEAEKAHEVYSKFLRERTLPNLWTVHPPFQIDGNLGTMAGVAEMLIQSHEGFIELLPALPKAWQTGSFDGLVARGNFELSLKWEKKKISSVKVLSKSGGKCSIKHSNIEGARIEDGTGKRIAYNMKGENIIEFSTNKSGEYYITF